MIRQRSEFMFPNIVLLYYSRTLYVRGEQTCVFCVAAAGSTAVVRVGRSGSKAFARRRRHPPELEFERKSTRLLSASLPFRTLRQRGGASPNPPPPRVAWQVHHHSELQSSFGQRKVVPVMSVHTAVRYRIEIGPIGEEVLPTPPTPPQAQAHIHAHHDHDHDTTPVHVP